jgi:hypothetical protein
VSEPEGEGFLARWARRKRESGEAADAEPPADAPADAAAEAAEGPRAPELPTIDLSALPPIDEITAATDIRPFLAPGVPAELTRAALRRAWLADPQIRDFVGIAENQWDFTDPNAIPGFGTLGPLDDIAKLVARVVGGMDDAAGLAAPAASAAQKSSPEPPAGENATASIATSDENAALTCQRPAAAMDAQGNDATEVTIAPQKQEEAGSDLPMRRGHGGALPR